MCKIYFDADGVLAVYDKSASLEEVFDPNGHYFLNREADEQMVDLLLLLSEQGEDVSILTHAPEGNAARDKMAWAAARGMGDIPMVVVPYGEDKGSYIEKGTAVLIDDYTKNLITWEAGGNVGIKYYNGINGTQGTWRGYSLHRNMTVQQMAVIVKAVANAASA